MKLGGVIAGIGAAIAALAILTRKASASEGSMDVQSDGNAKTWSAGMVIDADGAKGVYRADGKGLDYNANAKNKAGKWVGVVTDANGNPVDDGNGNYVSPTSMVDQSYHDTHDQRRYVDATTVPYLAIGKDVLDSMGAGLGDLAAVVYKGVVSPAIVADHAPRGHQHEGSVKLAQSLSIPSSPKNGGVSSGVTYVLFPATSKGWPRDFASDALALFNAWGGMSRVTGGQLVAGAPSDDAPTSGGLLTLGRRA